MGVQFQPQFGVHAQLLSEAGKEIDGVVDLVVGQVQAEALALFKTLVDRPVVVGIVQADLQRPQLQAVHQVAPDLGAGGMHIDRHAVADLAAQQLVNGQPQRLARQIPQRHFNARRRRHVGTAMPLDEHHRGRAAQVDAAIAVEVGHDALDFQRVAALQHHIEVVVDDVFGAHRVDELAGTGQAFLGIDAHEARIEAALQADGAHFADAKLGRARGARSLGVAHQRRIESRAQAATDKRSAIHSSLPAVLPKPIALLRKGKKLRTDEMSARILARTPP